MSLQGELPQSSLALGTAGFAFGGHPLEDAVTTIRGAVHGGVRLIDTARAYARPGEESTAEVIVGRALAQLEGADVLVATKGGHWRDGEAFPVDGRASTLRAHCEASLRALGVPQIDLYFLHHVDPVVPIEESVAALDELRREGLVRHVGVSNVSRDELDRASRVTEISAVQNRLSLAFPADLPLAGECARRGIVFLAYSPLGGAAAAPPPPAVEIARERGVSHAQVQLAWLRAVSPEIVPILGATRPATVADALRARELRLSPGALARLSAAHA
ncbi:aldo/keto reductase [Mycetocola zhujimingii]|uniref:aldo/keto reductase n=1 Tax=Mycetocola zhujimingii TaxID=2079792 RepID=UPI001304E0AE|nr:aldo/keto reductase [Mycetocola zhujimingii]